MNQSEIVIRKSPFLFLKRVAALIFFFALLPAFVAALLDLRSEYQASALAGIVLNYTLFVVLLLALVQFLLVAVAFMTWYLPVYLTFKGKEDFYIRTGNSSQPLPVSRSRSTCRRASADDH